MEWNEVDLVQEFTVEGQCSKIKVRSCRITWDSLQVNGAQRGAGRVRTVPAAPLLSAEPVDSFLLCVHVKLEGSGGSASWVSRLQKQPQK